MPQLLRSMVILRVPSIGTLQAHMLLCEKISRRMSDCHFDQHAHAALHEV
jgi:hypothetical protein